jgi:hypothetical protein
MKQITGLLGGILIVIACIVPLSLFAAPESSFTLSPLIVDEKAKQRDILKQTAVLTNNTNRKVTIYATVKNYDVIDGEQIFLDRYNTNVDTSLAHWIEITRGVIELEPGETKRIPYLIQVHLNAVSGIYHAKIMFQEGSNRDEAESRIKSWNAIDVNLEVVSDVRERLQLNTFAPEKIFFTGSTATFSYLLENVGNRAVAPNGEIRIFNRRGEEVGTIPANDQNVSLLPEAVSQLGAVWDAAGKFGRYKAYLDVSYGEKQVGTVNDTVYFWIVPWKQILILFFFLALIVAFTAYIFYERYGIGRRSGVVYTHVDEPQHMPGRYMSDLGSTVAQRAKTQTSVAAVAQQPRADSRPQSRMIGQTAQKTFSQKPRVQGQAMRVEARQRQVGERPAGAVVSLRKRG